MNRRNFFELAGSTSGYCLISGCDTRSKIVTTVARSFAPSLLGVFGIVAFTSLFIAYLQAQTESKIQVDLDETPDLSFPEIDDLRFDKSSPSGGLHEISGFDVDDATKWAVSGCAWPSIDSRELGARIATSSSGARVLFGMRGKDRRSGILKPAGSVPICPSTMLFLYNFAQLMEGVSNNVPTSKTFQPEMWRRLLPGLHKDSEKCEVHFEPKKVKYSTGYGMLVVENKGGGNYSLQHIPYQSSKYDQFEIPKFESYLENNVHQRLLSLDTTIFG